MLLNSLSFMRWSLSLLLLSILLSAPLHAKKLSYWQQSDNDSRQIVDHSQWQVLLNKYIISSQVNVMTKSSEPSVNLFAYASVSAQDKLALEALPDNVAAIRPALI